MDGSRTDGSTTVPEGPLPRRRRRILGATIAFVVLNLLVVGTLAAKGAVTGSTCGGGFSGYSGGGSCTVDLAITKYDAPDPVRVHGRLFYFLEVTNNGPSDVGYLEVQDRVPGSFRIDWVMQSQRYGGCSVQANLVFCEFYYLPMRQKVAVSIVVRPNLAGRFKNVATVDFGGTDSNPGNDRSAVFTTVTS